MEVILSQVDSLSADWLRPGHAGRSQPSSRKLPWSGPIKTAIMILTSTHSENRDGSWLDLAYLFILPVTGLGSNFEVLVPAFLISIISGPLSCGPTLRSVSLQNSHLVRP